VVAGLLERAGGQPPSQAATTHCLIDDDGVERCAGISEGVMKAVPTTLPASKAT
jgi:hypothetical protein